jgi:PAS domain S-box-containing protein
VADSTNLARAFDENITRTVDAVDQQLLFFRDAYEHDPAGFVRWSWARRSTFVDNLQVQMAVADRDGKVIWSNLGPVPAGISVADRKHFRFQKTSTGDELFISKPILGRVSGKWTINFSRRLCAPDGSFDGIAVVSLDPHYFSRFYRSISIGKGAIMLATTDGTILARAPEGEALIGAELPAAMKGRLLRGMIAGSYHAVSGIDHVERIYSFRRLDRYPLVIGVGLALHDVLAPYYLNTRLYLTVGILVSVASIIAGIVLARQRRSLDSSRQALAAALENMSEGIVMIDADGTVAVLNQRAIAMFGLPSEWADAKLTFQQIVDWQVQHSEFANEDAAPPRFPRTVGPTGFPGGTDRYERTRPNGTTIEVRTQVTPNGGFVRTYADITERKRTEASLAAARVRAAHAERMQVLGQLAGGIAHDFNNILQAVQGGATLIVKRAIDQESTQRLARMILDASERGASITRRLLAFARRGELRAEPVEVADLLSGLQEVLSHTLGGAINVELCLGADLPPLFADKGQLETVLVNLATNARDAMPEGGTLTFTAETDPTASATANLQPGNYLRLTISDTGTGMEQPVLARAPEPFFSTKPVGQGTGLGLSMAKGFVEQSGGAMSIDSAPGQGTTIRMWLPTTTRTETRPAPLPPAPPRVEGGQHVLLVDDEVMVRETLTVSLEDAGYIVSCAAEGAEALEILASEVQVDVLVTDLSMPGMDGLALIEKARKHRPGLSAVLLTGYAGHGAQLAVSGFVSGAFTLVRKPVTAAHLIDQIEALLAAKLPG